MEENGTPPGGCARRAAAHRIPEALILVTNDEALAMNQHAPISADAIANPPEPARLQDGKRIAVIRAGWHRDIVDNACDAFVDGMAARGVARAEIEHFEVPGSLEIPLQAQRLAKSGRYAVIVAAGLIVDGGIYRHDFVARTVLDGMMRVQLDTEVPVLSVVLTPHHFHEHGEHRAFFATHFRVKGAEAAEACAKTLANLALLDRDLRAA
jgi:6,7-dimethyl-8-ribityllumazine synthase